MNIKVKFLLSIIVLNAGLLDEVGDVYLFLSHF